MKITKTEKEQIRAVMSLLGKRKSKAKTIAARANAKKSRRKLTKSQARNMVRIRIKKQQNSTKSTT